MKSGDKSTENDMEETENALTCRQTNEKSIATPHSSIFTLSTNVSQVINSVTLFCCSLFRGGLQSVSRQACPELSRTTFFSSSVHPPLPPLFETHELSVKSHTHYSFSNLFLYTDRVAKCCINYDLLFYWLVIFVLTLVIYKQVELHKHVA